MDHLWYILGAYAAGVLTPLALAFGAWVRLTRVTAGLAALDPRSSRMGKHGGGS